MPTVKNGFHILNLHPKKYALKKYPFFNANLLEKFRIFFSRRRVLLLTMEFWIRFISYA